MVAAYVGVGSNLSDPIYQVKAAMSELGELPSSRLLCRSSLYRSKPVGPPSQPDYINAVCALETTLLPEFLLLALQAIEHAQGRVRLGERWGPRVIDLDILMYGDWVVDKENLQIPHPELLKRAFVVVPLAEIAPDLILPSGESILTIRESCSMESIERLGVL